MCPCDRKLVLIVVLNRTIRRTMVPVEIDAEKDLRARALNSPEILPFFSKLYTPSVINYKMLCQALSKLNSDRTQKKICVKAIS